MKLPSGSFSFESPGIWDTLQEWEAYATRLAAAVRWSEDAEERLDEARRHVAYLREHYRKIENMKVIGASIRRRLSFLEEAGFIVGKESTSATTLDLAYMNLPADRIVNIHVWFPVPDLFIFDVAVSYRHGASIRLRDWMAHKGRPFDSDARFELNAEDTVEHDIGAFEAEANGDMKDLLAGRAWEEVPQAKT